jgi:anti-sigma regulatory factor (Ser/Thr protein kinase)
LLSAWVVTCADVIPAAVKPLERSPIMPTVPVPAPERSILPTGSRPIRALPSAQRLSFTLPSVDAAVSSARSTVVDHLRLWGLPRDAEVVGTVELAVSELFTNVVNHAAEASPTAEITLAVTDHHLLLSVHDRLPALPRGAAAVAVDEIGGRGLWLLRALAHEAGGALNIRIDTDGGGKAVELSLPLAEAG